MDKQALFDQIKGGLIVSLICVMSRTVFARIPTAPDCAAAFAIKGMMPPSFVYKGSCSYA